MKTKPEIESKVKNKKYSKVARTVLNLQDPTQYNHQINELITQLDFIIQANPNGFDRSLNYLSNLLKEYKNNFNANQFKELSVWAAIQSENFTEYQQLYKFIAKELRKLFYLLQSSSSQELLLHQKELILSLENS